MYRVLIVDDEPIIRKGLRETIEWDNLGLEISGETGDGVSALEIIEKTLPHILITDIKMPEMDGIELIRIIRERGLNINIIILSGYSDSEYLKDAIKLGVDSYLLKPIDNDELTLNLCNTVQNIEKVTFQNMQQYQGVELLKLNLMNRLVTNNIRLKEFEDKASFLGIMLEAKRYICAVCLADFPSGEFGDDEQLALFAVKNVYAELIHDLGMAFIDTKGQIVLLFLGDTDDTLKDTAQAILSKAVSYVPEHLGISILVGVGIYVDTIEDIWESYDCAAKCLEYSIFIEKSGVIWYDKVSLDSNSDIAIHVNYDLIKRLLKSGEKEEFIAYIETIFDTLPTHAVSVNYVRNFVMRLTIEIISVFHSMGALADVPASMNYTALLTLRSAKEFKEYFYLLLEDLFAQTTFLQKKSSSIVDCVVSYIEEHYSENLTLKQMAAIYHINTSYLGQIFKKETGESFTSYINCFRIEKAKGLLADPSYKVYEIAEKVGFTDYYYFLKIFKKFTGGNPTETRN